MSGATLDTMASTRGGTALSRGGAAADAVDARTKAQKALDALLTGAAKTWDDAAKVAGYAEKGACWHAVDSLLSRVETAQAETYRGRQNAQLDVLERGQLMMLVEAFAQRDADKVAKLSPGMVRYLERRARLNGMDLTAEDEPAVPDAITEEIRRLAAELEQRAAGATVPAE